MEDIKTFFAEGRTLLIDKPLEWTSFDVVKKIRNTIRVKKVGHAGTLDPLATGLLIICTGKHTKKIESYQAQEKEYTGIFELGKTTPSFDLETEVDGTHSIEHVTEALLSEACSKLTGEISQVPPVFSAIKVGGERVYQKARRNEDVKLEPRQVFIKSFVLTKVDLPEVHFKIVCSKGTYIRSMARDFGEILGCGAYLKALRRTRIGEFHVDKGESVNSFVERIKEGNFQ